MTKFKKQSEEPGMSNLQDPLGAQFGIVEPDEEPTGKGMTDREISDLLDAPVTEERGSRAR